MMQCPWTFREFCFGILVAILFVAAVLFIAWRMDVSSREKFFASAIDTRLTDRNCWQWSTQHPVDSFNGCQKQFLGGGK